MSGRSKPISTTDFYPNINIFTEFGDLSPSQMLTLFDQFKNCPGYKDSPFLSSMESSLIKLETSDDTIDIEPDSETNQKPLSNEP